MKPHRIRVDLFTYADLRDLEYLARRRIAARPTRWRWVASPDALGVLAGCTSALGRPALDRAPGGGSPGVCFGCPVVPDDGLRGVQLYLEEVLLAADGDAMTNPPGR